MKELVEQHPKSPIRTGILLTLAAVLIAALAIGYAARHGFSVSGNGGSGGSHEAPPPPEVAVVEVQPERVTLTRELPGRTSPHLVAEVRPQVGGIVQKRLFEEGANVNEGDVLYQIDPALFQAALDIAEANLEAAQKAADRAQAGVAASLANVARQQATLKLARLDLERVAELAQDGVTSAQKRDQAVTNAEVAEAALGSAEAAVRSDREAVAVAEAAIHQAEAALQTARINLGYTRITAPISGRIGMSNVTVGALVTAFQPVAMASIQKLDPIYVDVPQSTAELLRLQQSLSDGQLAREGSDQNEVRLILENGTDYPLIGTLKFRDVTVEPTTGSVILRMVFPNPDGILLPGMYVRALVKEGVRERAILVPQQAVSRDTKGNPRAFVVTPEGKAEQRMLALEQAMAGKWLVSSGLNPGDRVIIEGALNVRSGDAVKAVFLEASPQETPGSAPSRQRTAEAN